MKLSRRNAGSAYGVHAYGFDFHIHAEGKGWRVLVRELVESVGVVHAIGQPVLHSAHEEKLSDIRAILDEFGNVDANEHPAVRWRIASGRFFDKESAKLRAELGI